MIPNLEEMRVVNGYSLLGFRGVELGAEAIVNYDKEELVAAKDAAGVDVINMSAALGQCTVLNISSMSFCVCSYILLFKFISLIIRWAKG